MTFRIWTLLLPIDRFSELSLDFITLLYTSFHLVYILLIAFKRNRMDIAEPFAVFINCEMSYVSDIAENAYKL